MPPVKIFVDSAHRVDGSDASFTFQLPRQIPVEKPYKAMVDQIHIPHVFPTIHAQNRALYIREINGSLDAWTKVLLTPNNYDITSLATEVQTQLRAQGNLTWTVTADEAQGKLLFSVSAGQGYIYPMGWMLKNPSQLGLPLGNHDDAGAIIGVTGTENGDVMIATQTPTAGKHVSVVPYHTLFLHCDQGLGTGEDAVGPQGNSTILRSIPVTTSYGQMLHDLSLNPFDYTIMQRGQIGTFRFRLSDRFGHDVQLDQSFSFSIILSPVDEFEE